METALQAVSTVGFPVVAYLLMFRLARDTIKENTEALQGLRQEMTRLKDNLDD